jgi:DNA modification methylase
MMKVEIKEVKISEIKLNPDNPRRISKQDMDRLVKSLNEFPDMLNIREIVVDETMTILGGNMRYLALKKSGAKAATAKIVTGLTKEQKREFVIKDNSNFGEYDFDALANGWSDLPLADWGVDLPEDWLGGDKSEPADAEPQIDRAEELNKTWGVKLGDLWQIGEHRLLCGDSTKKEDVVRVMGGEKADICFTSPPYGQQRDYDGGTKEKVSDWDTLMMGVFGNLPMSDNGQVLVNLGMIHRDGEWIPYWDNWIAWMRGQGWRRFGWYVWDQGFGLPGDWNGRLAPSHEFVFHFNHSSITANKTVQKNPENIGKRKKGQSTFRETDGTLKAFTSPEASAQPNKIPDSVIRVNRQIGRIGENIDHPAPFSVGFAEFVVSIWDGVAYEPFLGSGTTMVACQNLNRKCRGIEISEAYCSVILQRMQDAFEITGVRIEDGQKPKK